MPPPAMPLLNAAPVFATPAFAAPASPQLPMAAPPAATAPAAAPAPASEPAPRGTKSKLPLIIALTVVALAAIVFIVIFVTKR